MDEPTYRYLTLANPEDKLINEYASDGWRASSGESDG